MELYDISYHCLAQQKKLKKEYIYSKSKNYSNIQECVLEVICGRSRKK